MKKKNKEQDKVLNKNLWLSKALDCIAESGKGVPAVEDLCRKIGVSRGSFYWHFKNRQDFLRCLAEYWVEYSVEEVITKLNSFQGSAEDRLLLVMETVLLQNLGNHYLTMRSLAVYEPEIAKIFKKFDENRFSAIRGIFSEMGFRNTELEARVEAFVYFMTGEHVFAKDKPISVRKLKQWRDMFVKK